MDIDIARIAGLAVSSAESGAVTPTLPTAEAASQFLDLLNGTSQTGAADPGFSTAGFAGRDFGSKADRGLGDAILRGFQKAGADIAEDWRSISDLVGSKQTISVQEMMELQVKVLKMNLNIQCVSHVVTKAEQDIDQLVHVQ